MNAWNSKNLSFDNTENPNDQNYYVYLYHAVRTDHQYKSVKERVSYYYENGPKQGQPVPDRFQPKDYDLYFVRTQDVDLVTGAKKDWLIGHLMLRRLALITMVFHSKPFHLKIFTKN